MAIRIKSGLDVKLFEAKLKELKENKASKEAKLILLQKKL
jgi:hypothetical protein